MKLAGLTVAYWAVLVAALLPIGCAWLAKSGQMTRPRREAWWVDEVGPVAHHFAPHDFVNPGFIDFQLAQFFCQCIRVAQALGGYLATRCHRLGTQGAQALDQGIGQRVVARFGGKLLGGFHLLEAQLGIGVEIAVDFHQAGHVGGNVRPDRVLRLSGQAGRQRENGYGKIAHERRCKRHECLPRQSWGEG